MSGLVPVVKDSLIVKLEQARYLLAEARDVTETKQIRDQAKAIADILKQQRLSQEVVQDALELKLRAERRMGEFLKENINHKGGGDRKSQSRDGTAIRDLPEGVGKSQSSRWQKVAALPEEIFEDYLAESRRRGEECTTAGCIRLGW